MESKLIGAIVQALRDAFGETAGIYTQPMEQALEKPCFVVLPRSAARTAHPARRYRCDYLFDVQYYPAQEAFHTVAEVAESLFQVLETIPLADGPQRAAELRYELLDGVLHFYLRIVLFLQIENRQETMDGLSVKAGVPTERMD